ncbi:MAG: YjjG family noncanonical pyrimidine nucleotidase [Bacteroidota bacterium]|nr:YjjG family noncanonical pyrimidine nucleotidase [Bacteroidota bacterium]
MKPYRHLFFDLDHTLWDFETNAKETLYDLHLSNHLEQKGVYNFDSFFNQYSYHNNKLWDRYTKGFIKQEELRWKRMWLALLDFKIADEALAKKLGGEFLEILPFKQNLFPYTIEILTYLKNKNYGMHLITNGFDAVQHSKLASSKLTQFFTEVITSESSNSLKPNREIFEFAMQRCNATSTECIMIGDNLDADIAGAMNVGLDTVFVNHLCIDFDDYIEPTYTIHHLQELEDIF